jgi:pyruvate dehydrogenase E2 component (dihydrolipoamide acetyltransferase)
MCTRNGNARQPLDGLTAPAPARTIETAMGRTFSLPDLGEGLIEAEVVKVLVREGDVVAEDAPLLEVETDKATVEIPSPFAGRVARVHVAPGQTVKVGEALVTFADAGGGAPSSTAGEPRGLGGAPAPAPARAPSPPAARRPAAKVAPAEAASAGDKREGPVPATPATRRLARELGVDLRLVRATGPAGRVTDDDVRAAAGAEPATADAAERAAPAPAAPARPAAAKPLATVGLEPPALPDFARWGPVERQPLSHLRRTIAERMTLSAALVPHVTHFDRADVTDLDTLIRRNLDEGRERGLTLTLTAFLLKAAALALVEHPAFNASLDASAGELVLKRYVHIGVAVATERGLIVPVLREVDRKPLLEIQRELAALAERTREGKATLEDLRGGTFTLTNIGALGGTGALPIINYPEVAILGVARARLEPAVHEGRIAPRMLLPLTLTFDHRVADGADGARFAQAIVRRLEAPERLLLEW